MTLTRLDEPAAPVVNVAPGVTVSVVSGEVVVEPQNDLSPLAIPTLLRLAAKQVEASLGL